MLFHLNLSSSITLFFFYLVCPCLLLEVLKINLWTFLGYWITPKNLRRYIYVLQTTIRPFTSWIRKSYGFLWKEWAYLSTWMSWCITCIVIGSHCKNRIWRDRMVLIGKGVIQGYILSPYLLNLYTEYTQKSGLDSEKGAVKLCQRNITNTFLLSESCNHLKLLMKA